MRCGCCDAAGAWQFEVQAQDAAGNVAPSSLPAAWVMALQPGKAHALIASGPMGTTASTRAAFGLLVMPDLPHALPSHAVCGCGVRLRMRRASCCLSLQCCACRRCRRTQQSGLLPLRTQAWSAAWQAQATRQRPPGAHARALQAIHACATAAMHLLRVCAAPPARRPAATLLWTLLRQLCRYALQDLRYSRGCIMLCFVLCWTVSSLRCHTHATLFQLDGAPPSILASSTARLLFSASKPGCTFQCQLSRQGALSKQRGHHCYQPRPLSRCLGVLPPQRSGK